MTKGESETRGKRKTKKTGTGRPGRREKRRQKRWSSFKYALIFFIGAACIGAYMYYLPFFERQYRSSAPYPYYLTIEREAERRGVDEYLVAAIINNESKFRQGVSSHRGAKGLMQLMPETADWIAGRLEDKNYREERLSEPDLNIRYGTWYIAYLLELFEGNETLALAAYNAGSTVVHDWMESHGWDDHFAEVDKIPYDETRHYVKKVLTDRDRYRKLYSSQKKDNR